MATVSRWRPSRPVRLRLELVGGEVFLLALVIFTAGLLGLPSYIWFALVGVSIIAQSALFYRIGRVCEGLERHDSTRQ